MIAKSDKSAHLGTFAVHHELPSLTLWFRSVAGDSLFFWLHSFDKAVEIILVGFCDLAPQVLGLNNLSMPALARAMTAVGIYEGMLLDINPYWVHFTAIHTDSEKLLADPLFPAEMKQNADRFLTNGYSRDFFYITINRSRHSSSIQVN